MSSSLLLAQDVWHQTFLMLGDPELKVSLSQVDSQRAPWVIEADHSVVLAYSMSRCVAIRVTTARTLMKHRRGRLLRKSIGASGLWFKELDVRVPPLVY